MTAKLRIDDGPRSEDRPLATNTAPENFRRFGHYGPVYEVLGPAERSDRLRVRVLESGEIADLPTLQILSDPLAD